MALIAIVFVYLFYFVSELMTKYKVSVQRLDVEVLL